MVNRMGSSKPAIFAREATGLVREVGFGLGVIIILSHVVGLGWQKRAFQFTGPRPIPNELLPLGLPAIFWAFLICGIMVAITGYVAGYVTASMPRSGGGYVTISRVIHPFVGYIGGWLMFLAEAFSYGLIGVAVFEAIMIFYSIALAPTVVFFDATMLFLGGLLIIAVFTFLALFGVRQYGRVMHVMFWIPAIITVGFFAMWIAGAMDPSIVAAGVTEVMGAPPETFVDLALDSGMADNIASFGDAFTYAMAGAFWAYMGWYSVTFIAGEVKEANKKIPKVILVAGIVIMLIYLAASSLSAASTMNTAVRTVAGHDWSFFQAYSWLSYTGAGRTAAAAIPNFQPAWSTGIASLIARGMNMAWLSWLIALAGVIWLANDIPPFLLVGSRTLFAMSFDRMMPEKIAHVSERWHSPTWALALTGILGIFGCIAESNVAELAPYFGWAGMIGTDIFDAVFLTLFCLSAMLLPLERKEIYDRAAVKHSIGTVVGLGFIATAMAAFCLIIFLKESVSWIFTPATTADWYSALGFYGCIGVGVLLYVYYMYRNTVKGIDMRTLYVSIPPE
ncbi:APC family permease [Candidatus Bathyarchaeota archaeon]|nr:MAG: APC family permease [Candidatus Bathyarchaeota archaeon]